MTTECPLLNQDRTKVLGKVCNLRIDEGFWVGDIYLASGIAFNNIKLALVRHYSEADVNVGVVYDENSFKNRKELKATPAEVSNLTFIERIRNLESELFALRQENESLKKRMADSKLIF